MSQLIVIDRTPNDADEPTDITLPEGTLKLGHAAGLEWYRLPHGALAPSGSRAPADDELALARLTLPAIKTLKAAARRRIETEVGDVYELLADQARQIEALTALGARMAAEFLGGTEMSAEHRANYLQRVEAIVAAMDSGALTLRGEAEGADDMLMRLLDRADRTNRIIIDDYLPRRDKVLA